MESMQYANLKACKNEGMQVYKHFLRSKYASLQVCKYVRMQVWKYAYVSRKVCMYPSIKTKLWSEQKEKLQAGVELGLTQAETVSQELWLMKDWTRKLDLVYI